MPREHAALPVDGGDPVADLDGLHVPLVPVVRAFGRFAGLPGPDAPVLADDHGQVFVGGDRAGLYAFRQVGGCGIGCVVGQIPGMSVRVQEEEPLVEGLGLGEAHAWFLPDACGLDVAGVACVPGPGLPVGVQGEDPAAGGDGGGGLYLSGQAGLGLLQEFRVQVLAVGIIGPVDVDSSLPVHCQEPVIVHADAGEPGILVGVDNRGCCLSAGPCVDVLVGSQCGLPLAAGCGLQVVEPVGSLDRESNLHRCAVMGPCVDTAVASQAHNLVSCGLDTDVVRFLRVGRADGQPGAGGGPMVRAQRPVSQLRPLGFQDGVLEDGGPEVEGLAVMGPSVEPEALTCRVLLRGSGEGAGLHVRLCGCAAVGWVEAHCVRSLIVRLVGWLG